LERQRLAAEAVKEAAKEEQFHLKQSIERARKRLCEDRSQAIDELVAALHLQAEFPKRDALWRPHDVMRRMRVEEVQALLEAAQLLLVCTTTQSSGPKMNLYTPILHCT
jgi:hypothetical protein